MSTNEELVLRAEQAAAQVAKDKAEIQAMVTKLEEVQAPSIAVSKEDIKQALIEKGQTVDDTVPFSEYGNKVRAIEVGGNNGEEDPNKPLLLMHLNNNLDIQGKFADSQAVAKQYNAMYMEDSEYTPTYGEGVFGGSCLYLSPPTTEEVEYGEAWNKYIALPITNYFIDDDYTVDFWYKLVEGYPIDVRFDNSYSECYFISISQSKVTVGIYDGITSKVWSSSASFSSGTTEWHHIAFVRNNGIHKFYIDGVCKGTSDVLYVRHQKTLNLSIGHKSLTTAGYIDEFRITAKALWTEDFDVPTADDETYDTPINAVLELPFTDTVDQGLLSIHNPDGLSIGERAGLTGCVFLGTSKDSYLYGPIQMPMIYTASFWVYFDSENAMEIVGLGHYGESYGGLNVHKTAEGYINVDIPAASGITNSVAAVNYEGWNHVCVLCRSGLNYTGYIKLYVNGVDCGEAVPQVNYNKAMITIGGKAVNSAYTASFVGAMRKFKVVDKMLSEEQILQEYNAGA